MSRTNLQVITDSLRLCHVITEIETPSNEDAQDALRRLNDMMFSWRRQKGIDLGWVAQTSLAANIPVDDEYFEVVTLQLSKKLAAHWGFELPASTIQYANEQFASLLAEFIAPDAADMSHFIANGSRYSIENDS